MENTKTIGLALGRQKLHSLSHTFQVWPPREPYSLGHIQTLGVKLQEELQERLLRQCQEHHLREVTGIKDLSADCRSA